jgi:ArsR family transcriptional regulator
MNQLSTNPISTLFQILSVPPRLDILLAIGEREACVCHLEAALGYRQAYISQHLMALREASLLETRRDGRFIYYRLADRHILELLTLVGEMLGKPVVVLPIKLFSCECPNCTSSMAPILTSSGPESK